MSLHARADVPPGWVREGDLIVPWWHSKTGIIVRWVVFLVLFVLIMGYIIGGYLHARARIKKGLRPLAYHRCLVSRRERQPQYHNEWTQGAYGQYQPNAYMMANMAPPPVYDPNRPPVYTVPPEGGSKVGLSQWGNEPTHRPPEVNPAPGYYASPT